LNGAWRATPPFVRYRGKIVVLRAAAADHACGASAGAQPRYKPLVLALPLKLGDRRW
jgi:hypothetical protein